MSYKVPFVDFPKHYQGLKGEIDAAIQEVLTRGDYILRSQVSQFENNMASFLGVKYGVGVNSCTDGMFLTLRAVGLGQGDEIITVAHTFIATVAVIVHSGATPILVDIGDDFNMDVDHVEQAITPRTKAIIPVHLNGRCCNMEKLMKFAAKNNLTVIEDAAQALGATFDGKKAGTFGLASAYSFYPAKILGAAGDGGIVMTNDKELAEKVRFLRDHGRKTKEDIAFFGFNSRLDNLQAAILNVKFKYLPRWIEQRREIAKLYQEGLADMSDIILPPPPESQGHYYDIYQNYVIRTHRRDRLAKYLAECGIETLISWPKPMHYHKALGLNHFHLPRTEQISREVLSLPLIPEISNEQVEYVIKSIRAFYSGSCKK